MELDLPANLNEGRQPNLLPLRCTGREDTMTPVSPDGNRAHNQVVDELQSRWPEHKVAPSLSRIKALCRILGDPQHAAKVIHIAGTNGKGSTAIITDALLRSIGLRTGRFSSPHLEDVCERICVDGEPITPERFDQAWAEIKPAVEMVDAQALDGVRMTFFEIITAMAFSVFADAPVDVMVIECGMGGRWDATNVADADVAVICPIDYDHQKYLGETIAEIAAEKAGIIKPESTAVLAGQLPEAASVLVRHCADAGVEVLMEGPDFSVLERTRAVGGQMLRIASVTTPMDDLFLPIHGEHMSHNAALSLAAVQALIGGREIDAEVIRDGFAAVTAPARAERIHRDPPIVLDTCHNVHGAIATMNTIREAFGFEPCIGVVSMMKDKNVSDVMKVFAETMAAVVVTKTALTDRGMDLDEIADIAEGVFGRNRVLRANTMDEAISTAMANADAIGDNAGVVIAGSVIGAGEARAIIRRYPDTLVRDDANR